MRLLRVELTRLRLRRAVLLLVLAALVLPIVFVVATAWDTRPFSDDEVARAEADVATSVAECEAHPRQWGVAKKADPAKACPRMVGGTEGYLWRETLSLGEVLRGPSPVLVIALTTLGLLVGATFAGADWSSGSMSNQLLFEPRRGLLWLAKAVAATLGGALMATVALVLFWGLVAGLLHWRDIDAHPDGWIWIRDAFGRGLVAVSAAALGGFALTMLFRSTVGTLGLLLAVVALGSVAMALLPLEDPTPWLPHANLLALVEGGHVYWWEGTCPDADGRSMDCSEERLLALRHGLTYLGSALVAVCAASLVSFRRRDVP